MVGKDSDLDEQPRTIDLFRPALEMVAGRPDAEVTATCVVGDDIVIAAAAGTGASGQAPTRVGQRRPFVAPVGSTLAAFGDDTTPKFWLGHLAPGSEELREASRLLERVRHDS